MEKTGPEGAAAGSRRLYWYRTGGWTGGSVVDSVGGVTTRGAGGGELEGEDDTGGGEGDPVDAEEGEVVTETGSSGEAAGNRKDKETDGEGDTVEAGEA